MAVTQEDIAAKLGVSRRLVGYALSGHPAINEVTREKIQNTAREMGYRPHRVAQALASGRTHQIALCFPFLGSSYFNELIRQFEMLTQTTPYNLLIITYDPDEDELDPDDIEFTVDGMVFVGPAVKLPPAVNYPVVSLQNQSRYPLTPEEEARDRVQVGVEKASQEAMAHLLEQGYRRIAYSAAEDMLHQYEFRYQTYLTAMQEAGLEPEVLALPIPAEQLIRQQSHFYFREYFDRHGAPEALFCCNDDIGIGAYRALDDLGLSVPRDTAVIGFDDLHDVKYLKPPMTVAHMPVQAVCRAAWDMLMRRIENKKLPPMFESIETYLVVRESTLSALRAR